MRGLSGVEGHGRELFGTDQAWTLFASFGAVTVLGHLGGPWGDNSFYQRAFAIRFRSVATAFAAASFVFGVIPIAMGLLGFVAAGSHLAVSSGQQSVINAITIATFLPPIGSILFLVVVFSGLISILDSQYASIANVAGHDVHQLMWSDETLRSPLGSARTAMVILGVVGVLIANTPGVTVLSLFLVFAILRAAVWLPSMAAILAPESFSERGIFWGIVASTCCGLPLFIYGNLTNWPLVVLLGTCIATFGAMPFVAVDGLRAKLAKQKALTRDLVKE